MNGFRALLLLLLCSFGLVAQGSFRIGRLPNGDCNDWAFFSGTARKQMNTDRAILQTGDNCNQRIRINDREIGLTTVKQELPDRNWKVGRGGYEVLKGKDIKVRLDYIFTWLCPSQDENCEVYYYRGTVDITYKGEHRRLKIVGMGGS